MNVKQLYELGEEVFQKRSSLLMLWQEIAENFYPERADFTYTRTLGTDFAAGSMTSYPFLCRRDLGDQTGAMLRPTAKPWFHPGIKNQKVVRDTETRQQLQEFEDIQRRAMYDPDSKFIRSAKEGDHDWAAFGQTVQTVEMNWKKQAVLYRTYHLRDVAWIESEEGDICAVFRKWKPQARELCRLYPKTVHTNVTKMMEKTPFEEVECMHMVVDADMFDGDPLVGKRGQQPRMLICYDIKHQKELEVVPIWNRHYLIQRWQTVSGSQYAYSPATVAALPDARLLQAMTLTLLEAGEKITNPPMIATQEAVRSDINIYAGGVTWVDIEYDERLGQALRPLTTDAKGMPIGIDMQRDARMLISQAFYLNKLRPFLPTDDKEMTAYQAGQVVAQYIRDALPLFEPMEMERNGSVCEETFEILMRNGAFGNPRDWPRQMHGADIDWTFESPLHDAIEQQKGQKFLEMKQLLAEAIAADPTTAFIPDVKRALRDALMGIGVPPAWQRTEGQVEAAVAQAAKAKAEDDLLQRMQLGSETAANLAAANKDNAAAMAPV